MLFVVRHSWFDGCCLVLIVVVGGCVLWLFVLRKSSFVVGCLLRVVFFVYVVWCCSLFGCYMLLVVRCCVLVVGPCSVCCVLLRRVWYVLFVGCCWLFVFCDGRCSLFDVCCWLIVARCVLFVVCYVWLFACLLVLLYVTRCVLVECALLVV